MQKCIKGNFKKKYTFEERLKESRRIIEKYPDRIPIIVEKEKKNKDIPSIDRQKYLVPKDLTVGQFCYVIRKRIKLKETQAMFILCGNVLPPSSKEIDKLYDEYKDTDGFVYLTISSENTFGR